MMAKQVKKILLLVVLTLLPLSLAAQKIRFGVKGGLDVTDMKLKKEVFDTSNRMGWFIGPSLKLQLPVVGFDISALYSQRESKIGLDADMDDDVRYILSLTGMELPSAETVKTQQVMVPVNVRFSFGIGSTANVFVYGGPQFGFNVGDKEKSLFKEAGEWTVNSSNLSVNVGAGLTLGHIQLSANYNAAVGKTGEVKARSFSETYQQTVDTWSSDYNAWQIALAYYF